LIEPWQTNNIIHSWAVTPGEQHMYEFDEHDDEQWGLWDGQCQACDVYGPVDDMMLCENCGEKLERDLIRQREWDLIRQREWDYAATAFGLSPTDREKLRHQVIAQYGAALELIFPPEE
jgi:hypothetical protein